MSNQAKRKRLIAKADGLTSDICAFMFSHQCCMPDCHRSGAKDQGFCHHHIIRKGFGGANIKTRFRVFNVLWVCPTCHDRIHKMTRPQELRFLEEHWPEHYNFVTEEADRSPLAGNMLDYIEASIRDLKVIMGHIQEGSG